MTTSGDCNVCGKPAAAGSCWCIRLFKLVQDESSKSPYLVATRDIEKGTKIMSSRPIATGPSGSRPVCLGCLRALVYDVMSYQCSKCGWPVCDYKCQQSPMHQPECLAMQKAGFRLPKEMMKRVDFWREQFAIIGQRLLLLRCLLLTADQLDKLKKIKTPQNNSMNPWFSSILLPLVKYIRNVLKLTQFDEAEIAQVGFLLKFGNVCMPVEGIKDAFILEPREAVGVHVSDAVYLDHAFYPNLMFIETLEDPQTLQVVATKAIKRGEKLSAMKHGSPPELTSTVTRQQLSMCLPPCMCNNCMDVTELGFYFSSIKCLQCQGMVVPTTPSKILQSEWSCEKCGFVTSASHYLLMTNLVAFEILQAINKGSLRVLSSLIEKHSGPNGILHPMHFSIIEAKCAYCEQCVKNVSEMGAAFTVCSEDLTQFRIYSADLDSIYGTLFTTYNRPNFHVRKINCTSIMRSWIQKKISKKKAIKLLQAEIDRILQIAQPSYVPRSDALMFTNFIQETAIQMQRLKCSPQKPAS